MYPNWLIVEYATILFISFCNTPTTPATTVVTDPIHTIIINVSLLYSNIGDILINTYTPDTTIVAACSNALTGVGFSLIILIIIWILSSFSFYASHLISEDPFRGGPAYPLSFWFFPISLY